MGMDGVELILAVEDSFRVQLPDEDVGRVATVGDLHELVVSRLELGSVVRRDSARCLAGPAFYRVRRAIAQTMGTGLRTIRPSTTLRSVIPPRNRRARWSEIEGETGLRFPDRPISLAQVCVFLTGVAGCIGWGVIREAGRVLPGITGLLAGTVFAMITDPWLAVFPRQMLTVGDLVRDVVALNHGHLTAEARGWTREEAWESLCRIIVAQTGVEASRVVAEARIVDTLGID